MVEYRLKEQSDQKSTYAAREFTPAEKVILLNAKMLRSVANAPTLGIPNFPIEKHELEDLILAMMRKDFLKMLKESGLSNAVKVRPIRVRRSSMVEGETSYNHEIVEFSNEVKEGLAKLLAIIDAELKAAPSNGLGLDLYRRKFDGEVLLRAVERAIALLQSEAFWTTDQNANPGKPFFVFFAQMQQ